MIAVLCRTSSQMLAVVAELSKCLLAIPSMYVSVLMQSSRVMLSAEGYFLSGQYTYMCI